MNTTQLEERLAQLVRAKITQVSDQLAQDKGLELDSGLPNSCRGPGEQGDSGAGLQNNAGVAAGW